MRIGLVQLSVSDDPVANLPDTLAHIRTAAEQGAEFVLTPEVTNCVSTSRGHQKQVLNFPAHDQTLIRLMEEVKSLGIWLLAGSLAIKTEDPDGRFANRSFLIDPQGAIVATYDKIHMFDVQISESETYRESAGYRPGAQATIAETPFGRIGLTICYDIRFPHLYRDLAQAGATIITVPSAFSPHTGAAHWESLLRARAIETGCFILAPAQTGLHASKTHKTRETYGHSMVIDPWGKVLLDAGCDSGVKVLDIDLAEVTRARQRVPSLKHDRKYRV